jgi:hypothetical protein
MGGTGLPTRESKEASLTSTSIDDAKRVEVETSNSVEESQSKMDTTSTKDEPVITEKEAQAKKDEEEDMEYPHGFKLAVILGALCLAVFLVALDQTIISTAIPKITDHFHSIKDIGWYGSSYLLTATALQPTFGRIYTIFNVRLPSLRFHFQQD